MEEHNVAPEYNDMQISISFVPSIISEKAPGKDQSDIETDSPSSTSGTTHKEPTNTIQLYSNKKRKYLLEWEQTYRWLKKDNKSGRPFCIVCRQLLVNQKNHLERHEHTKKHVEHFQAALRLNEIQINESNTTCTDQNITKSHGFELDFVECSINKTEKRKYLKEWEYDFRWVKKDDKSGLPYCIACNKTLANKKYHLERHSETKKHKRKFKMQLLKSNETLMSELSRTLHCGPSFELVIDRPVPSADTYNLNKKIESNFLIDSTNSPERNKKKSLDKICQKFGAVIDQTLAAQNETDDEFYMKTILGMLKDIPCDVKDDLKEYIFLKVMEKKRKFNADPKLTRHFAGGVCLPENV